MNYYIVIPAYNEAAFIGLTLESLVSQTIQPKRVIVVNDNSTDHTSDIVKKFAGKNPWITLVEATSETMHMPGSKVIQAFNKGLQVLDQGYDFIVKLDADLILPRHYFETVISHFAADPKTGMAGGFAYIEKDGKWVLESLTDQDHIRGAFKAYRKACFQEIGGLKPAMGWDTADELLAKFHGWKVVTDQTLKVKHLKPTGASYSQSARYKQGEAFYSLGYGFLITMIASAKLSMKKKKPLLFLDYMMGYIKAKNSRKPLLVNPEQAKFIRGYRWKKIKSRIWGR